MKPKLKIVLTLALSMFVAGLAIGFYMYNKPHKNYAKQDADFSLTAEEFLEEFQENEQLSNSKYLGKTIQITGVVKAINDVAKGGKCLVFIDELYGVSCTMQNPGDNMLIKGFERVKVGVEITLKGRCDGMLTDVRLSECSISQE